MIVQPDSFFNCSLYESVNPIKLFVEIYLSNLAHKMEVLDYSTYQECIHFYPTPRYFTIPARQQARGKPNLPNPIKLTFIPS